MSGLGGLNKSAGGVVLGMVQLQLPVVDTPAQLAAQTAKIVAMVAKARRNLSTMDLVVFPEYSLHGLSMDTSPQIMCRPDEIVTCELRPDLVREARAGWGVENNIYQLYHRGYVAVKGGAQDCPYTYMTDMAAGRYRLPWQTAVQVTDGTPCGFAAPTRSYIGPEAHPLVPDSMPPASSPRKVA